MSTSFFDRHDNRRVIAEPYDYEYHVRVPDKYWGKTIGHYYESRFPYKDRDMWLNSMKEGKIKLNGREIFPEDVLPDNAIIDSFVENIIEPPINPEWKTIFEDEHLVIIDKPGHLPVHPTGRFFKHSYLQIALSKNPNQKVHLLHRLDNETSGLLIVGKTKELAAEFFKLFKEKKVKKEYKALVIGEFPEEEVVVDAPIGKAIRSGIGVKMEVNGSDAKEAISKYSLLERRGSISLIKCEPITGRTNQLRLHLEHINFPILGDKLYCHDDSVFNEYHENGETPWLKQRLILNRQALHAFKVSFTHPMTGQLMEFEAPLPADIDYWPDR